MALRTSIYISDVSQHETKYGNKVLPFDISNLAKVPAIALSELKANNKTKMKIFNKNFLQQIFINYTFHKPIIYLFPSFLFGFFNRGK